MNNIWITALASAAVSLAVAAEEPAKLQIVDPWVRALPPTQTNTAAYMTLVNHSEATITIASANADIAQKVEIHTTREIDGYMRMEQLPGLSIGPGETLQLAPGGTHLMLLQLSHMPMPGETPRLCVAFASGGEVCADAQVRKSAAPGQSHEKHQHHHN